MLDNVREEVRKAKLALHYRIHRKRQLRIFFLDDHDNIKDQAKFFMKWMHQFCHADRAVFKVNPQTGVIDPYATHVAAGRLEVYQEFVKLLSTNEDGLIRQLQQLEKDERI